MFPNLDNLWDEFFNRDFFKQSMQLGKSIPAANMTETENGYHIELAAPGFKKDDFKIEVDNGVISVSSEKKEEKEEKEGEKVTRKEFSYASFKRSFQMPENVKEDNISAEYKDGLLKLDLQKAQPAKPKDKKTVTVK